MNWLMLIGLYILGWLVISVFAARWYAEVAKPCKYSGAWGTECQIHIYCPTGDGEIGAPEVTKGMAFSLIWPLSLIPVIVYWLARRKPSPTAVRTRIARSERELGL